MIKHGRFYLPDTDSHFAQFLREDAYYQHEQFNAALKYVQSHDCFVDIGAHVGMWATMAVNAGFRRVIAFEPVKEHIECFTANVAELPADIELYDCMLGNGGYGKMEQFIEGNSGALRVHYSDSPEEGYSAIQKLDHILAGFPAISLMKLDVEGFEKRVLEGAKEVLDRCRPVIIVEQKSNKDAIDYLKEIGFTLVDRVKRDYIFAWR